MFDSYQLRIHECDGEIEHVLAELAINMPEPKEPLPKPKHRTRQPNNLILMSEKPYISGW